MPTPVHVNVTQQTPTQLHLHLNKPTALRDWKGERWNCEDDTRVSITRHQRDQRWVGASSPFSFRKRPSSVDRRVPFWLFYKKKDHTLRFYQAHNSTFNGQSSLPDVSLLSSFSFFFPNSWTSSPTTANTFVITFVRCRRRCWRWTLLTIAFHPSHYF